MLKKILLSCFAIFGLTFLLSSNSYAVSDLTYTLDSNTDTYFCADDIDNLPNCSGYKYLSIQTNFSFYNTSAYSQFTFTLDGSNVNNVYFSLATPNTLVNIEDFSRVRLFFIGNYNTLPSGWSITYTLSENNFSGGITPEGSLSITSNGTYDVTNYASATVNIDSDLPPYSQIVVDSFWQYHTAFGGAVVAIIAIFLVYRVIKGRLR